MKREKANEVTENPAPNFGQMRKIETAFAASAILKAYFPRAARTHPVRIPTAVAVVVVTAFLPVELSFYIAELRLTAARLVLILLFPIVCIWTCRKLTSGRYRFVASDLFVLLTGFWIVYAPANVIGVEGALNHAGPTALEFCMGYLVPRTMLSKQGQALSFASLLCCVIAFVALLALLDPLTNRSVTHETLSSLTGYQYFRSVLEPDYYRFGLLRASGPIENAILLATVCSAAFLVALSVPIRLRRFVIVASALGAIFAFSSAAIQAVVMGCGLLMYSKIPVRIPFRWSALVWIGAAGVLSLFLVVDEPVRLVIRHLTFDEQSGYYRYMTWNMVIDAVAQSPWYGIGFGPFPEDYIPHTVDSLWLVLAIQSGVPGSILVALSMVGSASLPTRGPSVNLTMADSKLGTALGIVIFLLAFLGFTVHFWGTTWIFVGLIAGLRAHLGELGRLDVERSLNTRTAAFVARERSIGPAARFLPGD
jgi:hypothetical protein